MVKFQIISDVHLEIRGYLVEFPVTAPLLILAGDTGNPESDLYRKFLQHQADRYEKVFLVNGNHDHFGRTREETERIVAEVCQTRQNLYFLNRTSFDLDEDHVIMGCTLWSEMKDEQRSDLYQYMGDLREIKGWSFEANNWQHQQEKAWLQKQIAEIEADGRLAIVVTHHCPSYNGTVAPKHVGDCISSGFCSDLDDMLRLPVACWCSGHSHWSFDRLVNSECRLVSNQLGNIQEQTGFDAKHYVDID